MWLANQFAVYVRWALSVSRKLTAIAPGVTALLVSSVLVNQISFLFALLLPLKVILLIGSAADATSIPGLHWVVDKDVLVIGSSVAAVVLYGLSVATSRLAEICTGRGAGRLVERSRKLPLFASQDGIARRAYRKFARSVATFLFVAISLSAIALIYHELFLFLLALVALMFLACSAAGEASPGIRNWLGEQVRPFMTAASVVTFFLVFGYIVVDYLLGKELNVIFTVISMLLARQALQRAATAVIDAVELSRQKVEINSLFFHGHALAPSQEREDRPFEMPLDPEDRERWLVQLLRDAVDPTLNAVEARWHQTGISGIVAFDVVAYRAGQQAGVFFVKLSSRNQRLIHEAALLGHSGVRELPAPRLLASVDLGSSHCVVFEGLPGGKPEARSVREITLDLMVASWQVEPPPDLVDRFLRSKPILIERLDAQMLRRLRFATNSREELLLLENVEASLEKLKDTLRSLPLFVYNPGCSVDTLRMDAAGTVVRTDWTRWSLEPVGAGWLAVEPELSGIDRRLALLAKENVRTSKVHPRAVRLAALMSAFETYCAQQKYASAIELLPSIAECVDAEAWAVAPSAAVS